MPFAGARVGSRQVTYGLVSASRPRLPGTGTCSMSASALWSSQQQYLATVPNHALMRIVHWQARFSAALDRGPQRPFFAC